jgi:two-component system chemotaxis response regulator CheB
MKRRDIIVIATSTGGLEALKILCSSWPPDLPASVFVVMHIGARPSILPLILQNFCALQVQHAADGERFEKSVIYIAPPDKHLLLFEDMTLLSRGPKENFTRPAADPLFRSAAVAYGQRVIGVVLTGDLDDGAAGAKAVQACGGYVAVQEPTDCRSPSMPCNALRAVRPDVVLPLSELGAAVVDALESAVDNAHQQDDATRKAAEIEARISRTKQSDTADLDALGMRSSLTCPDCGGVVWRVGNGLPLRYRCHTGHAFSAISLADEQRKQWENAVWQVVRRMEERIVLASERIEQERVNGGDVSFLLTTLASFEQAKQSALSILDDGPMLDVAGDPLP